ncbi:FAD-dependent oxidoreductase [Acidiphilium sp.]|uniref:oxidoreductase n=1 Tax=Acidiphilium sp. TaxID=527 RepID=UPI002582F8C2|nr:FAD-dependent oxidoreductase [Acidiphilium sp.]
MDQAMMPIQPYPHLLSPLRVGPLTLRNRVVMGSMHTRLEHFEDGVARQRAFYAERARGGVALLVTGGVGPNAAGLLEPGAPLLTEPAQGEAWRPVVRAVQDEGTPILMQILHAGRYAKHAEAVGASAIASSINPRSVHPLTHAEILATIADFARCAALAVEAGFDGVEVMGSEGYLLNQFAAARTNDRDDDWGGDAARRRRLPVAVTEAVRAVLGRDRLLVYRISAIDLVEGGADAEETVALARAIAAAGADALNTGIGWHEARVPTIAASVPRGAWRFATARLARAVAIPVIASNRINTPELAESVIAEGEAALVSMARPLLADPAFVHKAASGRAAEINTCIACNQGCLDYIFTNRSATCLVNPRAGRETEWPTPEPVARPRRIAVVGAGPAGLACATTAAARGHRVVLFEAGPAIGGQFLLAQAAPGKAEFAETLRYFGALLARHGVKQRLGRRAEADALAAEGFDAVVVATGALPRRPAIPGLDHPSVTGYADILSGAVVAGRRVAVIGAGGIGLDVAAFLAEEEDEPETHPDRFRAAWGVDGETRTAGGLAPPAVARPRREVTVLRRGLGRPGERLGVSTAWILRARLKSLGVSFITGCEYVGIDDAGLHYVLQGEPRTLAADTIVLCAGQEPDHALVEALTAAGVAAEAVGGAAEALELDALRAIEDGSRLGLRL